MLPLFTIIELANGVRDWGVIKTAPFFWYFYWFPWQPVFLVAVLSVWLVAAKPKYYTLPIAAICAFAGMLTPEKNLAVFFGFSTEPLIFVGFGWWSLIAGFAVSPALMWLAGIGVGASNADAKVC
jgi:hypothetical protein